MAAPLGLYEIFADPDHRQLIRAYCLEHIVSPRMDYDAIRTFAFPDVPSVPLNWNFLPFLQDDEIIVYGGYCDFQATRIDFNMIARGVALAYENLDEGLFISLGCRMLTPQLQFMSIQQRLRATLIYTVLRQEE